MKSGLRLGLACAAAILVSCCLAFGATYTVDGSKGHDAAAGTEAAPWKTISRGVKDLKPGDMLLIAPGVYRETVAVALRGTAESPITIQGSGGRVLITGADEIKGWKPCTKDDAGGHPNSDKIYRADVDFLPTVLLDARKDRPTTRFPREGFAACAAVTADTLSDTVNLTQSRDVWAMSLIHLRFADGKEERRIVLGFDPASHTFKLNRPLPAGANLGAGAVQYYIEGRLPGLAEGQWACENRGENKYRVYYWPVEGKMEGASIEMPRRTHQIDLGKAAYVTVDGLEAAYGAMPERAGEFAIGASADANDPASGAGLVVKNCIAHDHRRFGVWFYGCKKPVLRSSLVYNCGWGVMLGGNQGALVEQNEIGPNIVDGFRDTYGGSGTVVRRNYIHHHFDSDEHPDNVQLHDGVKNITFEDNLLLCGGQSVMMSEVEGFVFRNNVVAGSAANMIICVPVNDAVIERNTLCLGAMSILMPARSTRYKLSGNILVHNGGSLFYAIGAEMEAESDRNLFWVVPGVQAGRPWRAKTGAYAALEELQKASPLEKNSEFKDPQFKNAPLYVSIVPHFRPTDKSTPGRLYVDNPRLFAPGDNVETNFDGVARTVKAVEDGALVIDPPMARLTVFVFAVNWKDKKDFAYDFSTPFQGKYGSTIRVPAWRKGDFDGDGKRDLPDRPRDGSPVPFFAGSRPAS